MSRIGMIVPAAVVLAFVAVVAYGKAKSGKEGLPFLLPLFGDNMVLQRDVPAPVWGWTKPGKTVSVTMEGKTASTKAGSDGKWTIKIGPFPAGGPYSMTVTGERTVVVNNLMVGDVWICSGQSNMEQGIGAAGNPEAEIASANYPGIRLLPIPNRIAVSPEDVFTGAWEICRPDTVSRDGWGGFSAAGYYFGRMLNRETGVPIGLIQSDWGGTVAEAWVSREALAGIPDFTAALKQVSEMKLAGDRNEEQFVRDTAKWWKENDPGSRKEPGWEASNHDVAGWKTMALPTEWEKAGLPEFDGVVWFRRTVEVPTAWAGKDLLLHLGPVDDRDTTYVNGVAVGGLNQWDQPRDYKVPGKLIKAGNNLIAVRVLDTGGAGGLYGKPEQMKLELADGSASIPLTGNWLYKDSVALANTKPVPSKSDNPNIVTVLYNGMIAPLVPFAIKGAIWYQGESNVGRAEQYTRLLSALIADWRARFGVGDFPFYIVQLANYMKTNPEPGDDAWAELREAQAIVSRKVTNSGLAVAIDIGETEDIHPKNKQEVGRRLALNALAKDYGKKVEYSGPVYRSMKADGGKIRIEFDHAEGLNARGGGKVAGFAVADADKKWAWADASIAGSSVVVSSPAVGSPVHVRYAWGNNPVCNLYNSAGLPTAPFRTDAP